MRKKIFHMHLKQYLYILVFAVVSWDFLGEGREEAGKTSFAMDSAYQTSVYRFNPRTAKRPGLDQTKTVVHMDCSPVVAYLRSQDRKKTGPCEPV